MFSSKPAYSQVPAEIELERLHARSSDANDGTDDAAEAQQDEEDRHMPLTASREGHWCASNPAAAAAAPAAAAAAPAAAAATAMQATSAAA
uniref:Uncharacterized protein n=1 Tax=Tetradesmus obliquus TaxID=3088 RepID=A0A383WJ80_TETOB